jgi:FAD/FMN-containing dehydrogenase
LDVPPTYLEDASGFRGHADSLFAPSTGAELAEILGQASKSGVPVTVRGAGTGLTGGAVPRGGWLISTEKLSGLKVFDGSAVVGAGVPLQDIHQAAQERSQFFPPDPTEWSASIGGAIATNASGSRSFRFGATRKWVTAIEVAFVDGSLRRFERGDVPDFDITPVRVAGTTKSTAGFRLGSGVDWIDLIAGSEGALGVVTEATLQLLPRPGHLTTGVVFLPGDAQMIRAVGEWRGVDGLRMFEYLDAGSLNLLRSKYPEIPEGVRAALLFEQELPREDEAELDAWFDRLEAVDADLEGSWFATGDRDRERFRRFRHALPELVNDAVRRNGFMKLGSDYAVPVERNGEMLGIYRERLDAEFPSHYVIFGHVGDAHVHVNILSESQDEFDRGRELMFEFARQAVRLGGTVSAEHGLGKRKADLLSIQFSEAEIEAMRSVKRHLDPKWLLGRGNLFPPENAA